MSAQNIKNTSNNSESNNLLSVSEAAKILGVSSSTVRRLAEQAIIIENRDANGYRRFNVNDIINYKNHRLNTTKNPIENLAYVPINTRPKENLSESSASKPTESTAKTEAKNIVKKVKFKQGPLKRAVAKTQKNNVFKKAILASVVIGAALLAITIAKDFNNLSRETPDKNIQSALSIKKYIANYKRGDEKGTQRIQRQEAEVLAARARSPELRFTLNVPTNILSSLNITGPATVEGGVSTTTINFTGASTINGLLAIDAVSKNSLENSLELTGDIIGTLNANALADNIIDGNNLVPDFTYEDNFNLNGTLAIGGTWSIGGTNVNATAEELNFLEGSTADEGGIIFGSGSGFMQDTAYLFYNSATHALGINTNNPQSPLSVGTASQFQVNASGDIIKINNVTYAWPTTQAGAASYVLANDGNGTLAWTTVGAASVGPDSLDFTEFKDAMTLDDSTDIAITGANQFSLTNTGTGVSFLVNDSAGDTSPFVIDSSGNVGIGKIAPAQALDLVGAMVLENTSSPTTGVIYKESASFIHNYHWEGNTGQNTFVGENSGNFTLGQGSPDASIASYNTGLGYNALSTLTYGRSNTAVGAGALSNIDSGNYNSALGAAALYSNTNGNYNSAFGSSALYSNTTGNDNLAFGPFAMFNNTTGVSNVALGKHALASNTTGSYNLVLGNYALYFNTTGGNNIAAGYNALYFNSTGNRNIAVGGSALYSNTSGANNIATGDHALYSNTTGSYNFAAGFYALYFNSTGNYNIATGDYALASNTSGPANIATGSYALYSNTTGNSNVATGYNALYFNSTGSFNTAFGNSALYSNSTGNYNIAAGAFALYSNTSGSNNIAAGYLALFSNTTGTGNISLGNDSLSSNTTGSYNYAFGPSALRRNTTGGSNVAVGNNSMYYNTIGTGNIAIGGTTLYTNTTGNYNIASGISALYFNTTGSNNIATGTNALFRNTVGTDNIATGRDALIFNTSGSFNVAVGSSALYSNTTASYNSAFGYSALYSNTTGNSNVAIGRSALYSNTTGSYNSALGTSTLYSNSTGDYNLAAGYFALYENTSGSYNTAVGPYTLRQNTTGSYNSAFGTNALRTNTTGNYNVGVGYTALRYNTTGSDNAALGYQALFSNVSGNGNSAVGSGALYTNTGGNYNSSFGSYALYSNTTGSQNSAVGYFSLTTNTTGIDNTAVGYFSLQANTSGSQNSSFGAYALSSNTTGNYNIAFGSEALYLNTYGYYNVALGHQALRANSTGGQNIATGYRTLYSNLTGQSNAGVGFETLYTNSTGSSNSAFGEQALYENTTGSYNTTSGVASLYHNTTGYWNTAIGVFAGTYLADGASPNSTSITSLYLGSQTKALADGGENEVVIGFGAIGAGSNSVVLGNDSILTTLLKGVVGIGTTSPSAELHVLGSFKLEDSYGKSTSLYTESFGSGDGYLRLDAGGTSGKSFVVRDIYDEVFHVGVSNGYSYFRDFLDVGDIVYAGGGFHIGNAVDANLLDDSSNGSGSTTMYIGNASINVTASDRRLKDNIETSNLNALELINRFEVVDFDWKEGTKWADRGRATGLIAQDVYEYLPQVVDKPDDPANTWSIEYHHLVPYLIKGIQEQEQKIEDLQEQLAQLEVDTETQTNLTQTNTIEVTPEDTTYIDSKIQELKDTYESFKGFAEALGLTTQTQDSTTTMTLDANFLVTGDTTLGGLTITKDLQVGSIRLESLTNELSVIGPSCYTKATGSLNEELCELQTIYFQKNLSGNIDFMDGAILFEADGTVRIEGEVEAKTITAQDYKYLSNSETIGQSAIKSGESSVTVEVRGISKDAIVFITPTTDTKGQQLYVSKITESESFKVSISKTIDEDSSFNWWVLKSE
ncbi:tail fiber domain-containing protein [Candidatus Nomurabacteria bacterium]|nr:tail fiber domain-containing protein [Candidatus Nomurabacteria bacterium]MCB9827421.1 tail fiber domain-containing protein [Candidatus Nomurabacteria bacterium]